MNSIRSWEQARAFEACRAATGRSVVTSVEYCKDPEDCGRWIRSVANLWRTSADIQATWASVMANILANDRMAAVARPGHFNDPDMLQVGNVGLSYEEQKAQMSLWCVASAPLLVATDVVGISPETLALLTNPEVGAAERPRNYTVTCTTQ